MSARPAPAPDPMLPVPARIRHVVRETADTVTFHLVPRRPIRFAPGQFDMLYLHGAGELPISMCGDPEKPEDLVHTIRAVGAVSRAMVALRPGDMLGVRGPFGRPWPAQEAWDKDVLMVAGGLGLAPLRSALHLVARHRDRFRRAALLYGARTPADLLYRRELGRWERHDIMVRTTVDRRQIGWSGRVGVVTGLFQDLHLHPLDTVALLCGPETMTRFAVRDLARLGVPLERVFVILERNMKCGVGLCGHCQYGRYFVCRDGPVFRLDEIADLFHVREV